MTKPSSSDWKREVLAGVRFSLGFMAPVGIAYLLIIGAASGKYRSWQAVGWRLRNSIFARGGRALFAGDTVRAKGYAKAILWSAPNDRQANLLLADALQTEGNSKSAYGIYDRWFVPEIMQSVDQRRLSLFGAAAEAVGKSDLALIAYRQVIRLNLSYVPRETVSAILSSQAKVSNAHVVADTIHIVCAKQTGYLGSLQKALHQKPNDPCLHYLRAEVLADSGRLSEAKIEVDRAAMKLSPDAASHFRRSCATQFRFYRLDPGYLAAVGKKAS